MDILSKNLDMIEESVNELEDIIKDYLRLWK